jgi:hypothetical protein
VPQTILFHRERPYPADPQKHASLHLLSFTRREGREFACGFILNPHQSSQYPAPVRQNRSRRSLSTHTLHRHRPTTVVTHHLEAEGAELSPPPLFTRAHSTSSPDHQPTARHISLSARPASRLTLAIWPRCTAAGSSSSSRPRSSRRCCSSRHALLPPQTAARTRPATAPTRACRRPPSPPTARRLRRLRRRTRTRHRRGLTFPTSSLRRVVVAAAVVGGTAATRRRRRPTPSCRGTPGTTRRRRRPRPPRRAGGVVFFLGRPSW